MSDFTDKLKEKAKDKLLGAGESAKDTVTGHDGTELLPKLDKKTIR